MEAGELLPGAGAQTLAVGAAVLEAWPEHAKFLKTSFAERSSDLLETTEEIAGLLARVCVARQRPLAAFAQDYRYLVEQLVYPEEVFFAREGRYRLSTFAEAASEVYDNAPLMARYMNGLFVSDALWLNHASAMHDFARIYLPDSKPGGRHLEIGPGHGLLLHFALEHGDFSSLSAWDVSATSIAHAGAVLATLGEEGRVDLALRDLYGPLGEDRGRYDTIVLSEVLEHLERPAQAIDIIGELLAPGGSVWINVPANGPAPDHLFLLTNPAEAEALVASRGLKVMRSVGYPVAGATLERAIKQARPVSCVVVASKAN